MHATFMMTFPDWVPKFTITYEAPEPTNRCLLPTKRSNKSSVRNIELGRHI